MTGALIEGQVYVEAGAVIEPTAYVKGPAYIGKGAEVRHGAYIRGDVYVGPGAVVGHATEVKSAVFFDGAKAGHFAYVGDAILGREVNLGAGTKLANLGLRRGTVRIKHPDTGQLIDTGLKKFSAIMGDESQTGCNAVLSPGTLLLPKTAVLPCVHFRGTLKAGLGR
jgi:NDP-sugar pyrophosphorylase family protein